MDFDAAFIAATVMVAPTTPTTKAKSRMMSFMPAKLFLTIPAKKLIS